MAQTYDWVLAQARQVGLLIVDVDGVLTDGKLFFDRQGREHKAFHAQDGLGLKLVQQHGVAVAAISGRQSESVDRRMRQLGVGHVYQGYEDKRAALADLLSTLNLSAGRAAHVGDDLLDLPVMRRVGLAIAVNDANPAVKRHAHWVTARGGGQGAVREVCDLLMTAQGHYDHIVDAYLK